MIPKFNRRQQHLELREFRRFERFAQGIADFDALNGDVVGAGQRGEQGVELRGVPLERVDECLRLR